MRYFGIQTPKRENKDRYIWWIASSEHEAWMSFFTYPSKDKEMNAHRLPLYDAILAYTSIGYRCVELIVTVKSACPLPEPYSEDEDDD